jgi:hypothetical protein
LAGEGRTAANFASAELRSGEGIGDSGGDWRRGASILSARRERTARRTFPARRGGKGRCRTAALPGGRGGGCRCARERESQREEEERMGNLGFLAAAQGLYRPAAVGGDDLDRWGQGGGLGGLHSATELLPGWR